MKILILSMNFAPELTGIGKYSGDMAEGLVDRGHEVKVVCAPPYYPAWRVQDGFQRASYRVESPRPGLTVYRCPLWVPKRPGGLSRLLHLASFAASSLPVMLGLAAWRPDAVFTVVPSLGAAAAGRLSAWLCGATAWLHVQDFEVDAAFELGHLRGTSTRQKLLALERGLLSSFDVVSTISHRMLAKLVAKGVARDRTQLLPNGVDVRAIRPSAQPSTLREELRIADHQVVCLYSGTMNRKQGLPMLIDAARRLQHREDLVFVLSGTGECWAELEQAAAGLRNVRLRGLCPPERLNDLLNMADIHLLPQLRGATDLVLPSKLTGMLASGRPIIAAAESGSEIATIVEGRGLVVEPESPQALVEAVEILSANTSMREAMGRAARTYAVDQLDQSVLLDRLHTQLLRTRPLEGVPARPY